MMKKYYKVLTVAGSDSSGGAGIQADLKTFSALGCYGMSVITALTAQNTRRVLSRRTFLKLLFSREERFVILEGERIESRNVHGTGCTLSSAIASFLAKGEDIEAAVRKGKAYISEAIRAGSEYEIGHGSGPVHHFFNFWV